MRTTQINLKFKLTYLAVLLLALLLSACGGGSSEGDIHLTEIVIFVPDGHKTPYVNDTFQLDAAGIYTNDRATETLTSKASWTSSNPKVATVSDAGEVTTLSAGDVIITANYADISRGVKLTVSLPPAIESLIISEVESGYIVGEDQVLELIAVATFDDTKTSADNALISWTTSDPDGEIAKIDENGRIFGIHYGEVVITATAKENNEISAEVTVTVKAKVESIILEDEISYTEIGTDDDLMVYEKLSDGTTSEISKQVQWDYEPKDIVRISQFGKILATGLGEVTLTATVGDFELTHTLIIEDPIELFVTADTGGFINLAWHKKHAASSYTLYWNNGEENEEDKIIEFTDGQLSYTHSDIDTSKAYYYQLEFTRNDKPSARSKKMKVWTHKGIWQFRDYIEPRLNAAGASHNENMYLFGGELINPKIPDTPVTTTTTAEVWEYNIKKNKWTRVDSLETPLKNATACTNNDFIYLIGGQGETDTVVASIHEYNTNTGKWTFNKATLPVALSKVSCNIVNNIIYIAGGYDGTTAVATSYGYDITNNSWIESLPALNTARYRHASSVLDDKIYIAGGKTANDNATKQVEVFDTAAADAEKTWVLSKDMLTPRADFALHSWNNTLHAMGGINNDKTLISDISSFSPGDENWQLLGSMVFNNAAFNSTQFNNAIYLWGGSQEAQEDSEGKSNFMRYSIDDGSWIHDSNINAARIEFSAVMLDEKLYVIGGADATGGPTTDVRIYDTQNNSWDNLNFSLLKARQNASAVAYQHESLRRIYVLGGINGTEHLQNMEIFNLTENTQDTNDGMVVGRTAAAAAILDLKIYIFGGQSDKAKQTFEVFDTTRNRWQTLRDMPHARSHATAVALNNDIYLIGGYLYSDEYVGGKITTNVVDVYRPSANIWEVAGTTNIKRIHAGSTMLNGLIYIFGGIGESGKALASVETYTPFTKKWNEIISKLPLAATTVQGGSFENKIYVVGQDGHLNLSNNIYVLD